MQLCRIIYYSIVPWLLYMFRAILSFIIRSIVTIITASGFIHMHCCQLLSWLSHSKHVQQPRNNGIIYYPTQLHLVGHFCKDRIMMHGTMNVIREQLLLSSPLFHFSFQIDPNRFSLLRYSIFLED